jgi:transcriptional regulator with XRE-family HTH domain
MAKDGSISRGPASRAPRRGAVRARASWGQGVSLSRVRDSWDHEAFRNYVIECARNAGFTIDSTADIARATGDEITRAMLGKWFAGRERPSDASLRKLARHIKAPLPDLLVLAGRNDAAELGTLPVPFVAPVLDSLVRELNDVLAANSPVPPDLQQKVRLLVDAVLEEPRRFMRAAKHRRHSA